MEPILLACCYNILLAFDMSFTVDQIKAYNYIKKYKYCYFYLHAMKYLK